jgi:uncharacterized protein YajQ (UPF0234 family)
MALDSSFDVVSEFDRQELVNAIDQTVREIRTRFDLKDTKSEIRLDKDTLALQAPAEITLNSVRDLLESKMVRRGLSLKILRLGPVERAAHGSVRQTITLQRGISQDLARDITRIIREGYPKARAQMQGDAMRVTSKSKDELQSIIATLKAKDYPVPLQFTNYR